MLRAIQIKKVIYLLPFIFFGYGCVGSYQEITDDNYGDSPNGSSWDPDIDGPRKSTKKIKKYPSKVPFTNKQQVSPPQTRSYRYNRHNYRYNRHNYRYNRHNYRYNRRNYRRGYAQRRYLKARNFYRRKIRRYRRKIIYLRRGIKRLQASVEGDNYRGYPRWYARAVQKHYRRIRFYNRVIRKYRTKLLILRNRFIARYGFLPRGNLKHSRRFARPPKNDPTPFNKKRIIPKAPTDPTMPIDPPPTKSPQSFKNTPSNGFVPNVAPPSSSNSFQDRDFSRGKGQIGEVLERWQRYCQQEKSKYAQVKIPRVSATKKFESKWTTWKIATLKNVVSDSIKPLYSKQRFTFLGLGGRFSYAHCEDRPFFLWDNKQQKRISVRAPVTRFLLSHTRWFPWMRGIKNRAIEETLVDYAPEQKRAGILLKLVTSSSKNYHYHYVYLLWNLAINKIVRGWELGPKGCSNSYRAIGVSPKNHLFYYLQNRFEANSICGKTFLKQGQSREHRLNVLNLKTGMRRVIGVFKHQYRIETIVPNADFSHIAVVEYAEMKNERGKVFLFNTSSGRKIQHYIPRAPYGVVFSPDQRYLVIYGSKNGVLLQIPLNPVLRKRSFKSYRRGHALGFSSDGRFLISLFHGGVELRDAKTLEKKNFISLRKIIGKVKFLHVDGSIIVGGTLFIKNANTLYVQSLLNSKN